MLDFSHLRPEERHVLIADDEPMVHSVLTAILNRLGFTAISAYDGLEAAKQLQAVRLPLVFTDINMPGMNGIDLCRWVRTHAPDTSVIAISGGTDLTTVVEVMQLGACDYIQKPFTVQAIAISLQKTFEKRTLVIENRNYVANLESMVQARTVELRKALHDAERSFDNTIVAFALALEMREHETHEHSIRVRDYAMLLARRAGLAGSEIHNLSVGAILHDIGKIGVPDRILLKPGPLTPDEWTVMRQHPVIGARMIDRIDSLPGATHVVLSHHEWFDGSGYPHGLRQDRIPLEARLFAVADTLDAMTSDRPYRSALSFEEAYAEVGRNTERQFDPEIVRVFRDIPMADFLAIRDRVATDAPTPSAGS
ncbi:MAG TPA: response regulator [Acidobacteriota bacterium]|jgi:putative nucleotidyltransferase with HDIG domain|nr:response regulator [Acidobacteriota bacterium]HNR37955.1 response regulator [Acidobacteriota bacterium]HNU00397.1 response regulator [Acidobacteriota bacterium]HPB27994.1 response regulator [Acidobacteriota bacterium]HQO24669.1 response regulator [Acidobacteriota bacterium]